jgi:hypothetical protein
MTTTTKRGRGRPPQWLVINGVRFDTLSHAARALDCSLNTLKRRIYLGQVTLSDVYSPLSLAGVYLSGTDLTTSRDVLCENNTKLVAYYRPPSAFSVAGQRELKRAQEQYRASNPA